jgi:Meiotically up-regulated gene 113
LQTGNPRELVVLASVSLLHSGDAVRLEDELHDRLWRHRVRGEWFQPVPELMAAVAAAQGIARPVERARDALALLGLADTPRAKFAVKMRAKGAA